MIISQNIDEEILKETYCKNCHSVALRGGVFISRGYIAGSKHFSPEAYLIEPDIQMKS